MTRKQLVAVVYTSAVVAGCIMAAGVYQSSAGVELGSQNKIVANKAKAVMQGCAETQQKLEACRTALGKRIVENQELMLQLADMEAELALEKQDAAEQLLELSNLRIMVANKPECECGN